MKDQVTSCIKCLYNSTNYPGIQLDEKGVCDVCDIYEKMNEKLVHGEEATRRLEKLVAEIKLSGKNKKYDSIVGVSGGVDSSYIAYLAKKWGLKPLVIHIDNGWNSELAVGNIERLLDKLDFDLYTEVLDWDQMKDLQKAFFKASVLDIDLPFDNAFMAVLYQLASKFGIKYIISGHNTVTEGWMPDNFCHYKLDTINIKDIHKKFGTTSIRKFPLIGPLRVWYYQKIKKIEFVSPLDLVEYNKEKVKQFLQDEFDWRDYGGKHYENIFTKFYQGYILPEKFKVDKRISHQSTLICSGQVTREQALEELKKAPYDSEELKKDKQFFIKKLGLNEIDFEEIMSSPPVLHRAYKSYMNVFSVLSKIKQFLIKKN